MARPLEGEEALSSKLGVDVDSESKKEGELSRKKRLALVIVALITYGVTMASAGVVTGVGVSEIAHGIANAKAAARRRAEEELRELATEVPDMFNDEYDPDYPGSGADPLWIPVSEAEDIDTGAV